MTIYVDGNASNAQWYQVNKGKGSAAAQGLTEDVTNKTQNTGDAVHFAEPSEAGTKNAKPRFADAVSRSLLKAQEARSVESTGNSQNASSEKSVQSDEQRFNEIMFDAIEGDGYEDPEGYIRSLPSEDIEVLRRVHGLKGSGDILSLIREDSIAGLLMPPNINYGGAASSDRVGHAEPEPEVKVINGKSVIVSGHSVDNSDAVSFFHTANAENYINFSPEFLAQLAREMEGEEGDAPSVIGGMQVISNSPFEERPLGMAVKAYEPVTYTWPDGNRDNMLGWDIPNNEAEKIAQNREQVEAYMNALDVEEQLQAEYGDDVKLAYSFVDDSYIMLTPDDQLYNEIPPASDGVQGIMANIRNGHIDANSVADIFEAHGHGGLLKNYGYKA